MEKFSDTLIDGSIEKHTNGSAEITGTQLGRRVEEDVQEKTKELRKEFGDSVNELIGDADQDVKNYKKSLDELVGEHTLSNTEEQDAAGINDKSKGNTVLLSKKSAEREVDDKAYRKKVRIHEEKHQNDHTLETNRAEINYVDSSGNIKKASVVGDLTEHSAIRAADQDDDELTPDYVEHAEIGDEVIDIAGKQEVETALKSGDAEKLQQVIVEKQRDEMMELMMRDPNTAKQSALAA